MSSLETIFVTLQTSLLRIVAVCEFVDVVGLKVLHPGPVITQPARRCSESSLTTFNGRNISLLLEKLA